MRRKLSYSNVVATAALFIALGGGAYAAIKLPANSVGTKQIKDAAITPAKLSKAARGSLKGSPGAQGAQGAQGPAGPAGPSDLYQAPDNSEVLIVSLAEKTAVASLTVPAGSYLLVAKQVVFSAPEPGEIYCELTVNGTARDNFAASLPGHGENRTIVGTAAVTVPESASITDLCQAYEEPIHLQAHSVKLSALKVGTIH